jgi:Carboxypeptidase regulatory-like domain
MAKKTQGRTKVVLGACGWLLMVFAVGCEDRPSPSPIAPDSQSPTAYRIEGEVRDKLGLPLTDAVVTILDGPLAGTTTRTTEAGKFEFGVPSPGLTSLRASRDGFVSQTQAARVHPIPGAVTGVSFWLESLEPPIRLEPGTYTLAVTVDLATARDWKERPDTTCAGFPVALASRSYRAEVKETARLGSSYTHSVTAEDPTLRWRDLFAFFVSGSYVKFEMEGGVNAGVYEDFPGFRYLEIGGHTKPTEPAISSGSSISIPFAGAISYCQLKSARGVNEDCYQVPAEQILEHHVCMSDHLTLVFTPR